MRVHVSISRGPAFPFLQLSREAFWSSRIVETFGDTEMSQKTLINLNRWKILEAIDKP